jgi:diaminohydroxyphosphoribosylaminopyrimidine deaminase/5-amino-6-(5-phosphoribosylamino)uracil reductase
VLERDPVVDTEFMERCLVLALQAEGRTAPNPVVGAVVTDAEGRIVGEGYHQKAGEPHAEVFAFDAAGERARGGTLYVNLEPCCHYGKTPPCAERVIASGVTRVVVGMQDPNPKVGGGGIAALRGAGITVDLAVMEEECQWANRAFVSKITRHRPWVTLKMAATLDGRIADREGRSRWISGGVAQAYVQKLRNTNDCILIGANTARIDDPELTVRDVPGGRNPARAVIDTRATLNETARLLIDRNDGSRVFIFTDVKVTNGFPAHVEVVKTESKDGRLNLQLVLAHLGGAGINSVLCEGGGKLAGSLLEAGLVDEVHWIVAPKILCDDRAVSSVSSELAVPLEDLRMLKNIRVERLGNDVIIVGTL